LNILMRLCGLLFLLIIIVDFVSLAFGNKTINGSDSNAKLQKISGDPNKFKISIGLVLLGRFSIIALAIMLFVVFSPYNIILGIVGTIARIGEGLIQVYNEKNYWGLLNIARQYSGTSGAEKNSWSDLALTIHKTQDSRFKFSLIFWAIGMLAYSIVFVTYGVVPLFIGWIGIIAGILVGFGSGIQLVKPKGPFEMVGLLTIVLEVILGGWLLFFSPIIP